MKTPSASLSRLGPSSFDEAVCISVNVEEVRQQ